MFQRCINCMHPIAAGQTRCETCGQQQDAKSALHHLPPGIQLKNRYLLGKVLFEDAFFLTYSAWDLKEQKSIWIVEFYPKFCAERTAAQSSAVKVLGERYGELGQTFLSVQHAMQKISGLSNVLVSTDLFNENNTAYAAVQGLQNAQTLDILLQKNKVNLDTLVQWMRPVLKDLYLLHKKSILHTRISAKQILICNDQAYLMGFGISADVRLKAACADPALFSSFLPAPEQLLPGQKLQPSVDVYGMAAIFYQAAAGMPPEKTSQRIVRDRLLPPSSLRPEISRRLDAVMEKGLALDAEKRYTGMDGFFGELLEAMAAEKPAKTADAEEIRKPRRTDGKRKKKAFSLSSVPATFSCGLLLVVLSIFLAASAGLFVVKDPRAAQVQTGVFENGLLLADEIENLQAVDTDLLVLKNCDFSEFQTELLTTNPIITSLEIVDPENLTSLAFLKNFPQLKTLRLSGCQIKDEMLKDSGLETMRFLETIDLSSNQLTKIDWAAGLTNLVWADFSQNQIESMEPLTDLRSLQVINLSGNKIQEFLPLTSQEDLRVDLSENQISTIAAPEENASYFTVLSLYDNPVFSGDYEAYQSLSAVKGDTLYISYEYDEKHLDENGVELAAYTLTFNNFSNNVFLGTGKSSQEWITSYFAGRSCTFIEPEEAQKLVKEALSV